MDIIIKNKQTPIDYIKDNLFYPIQLNQLKRVLNEAEQMHKEQIKESFVNAYLIAEDGLSYDFAKIIAEQYYNETYNVKDN